MKRLIPLMILFALAGCGPREDYAQKVKFHDNGRTKPVVAFVPVVDQSKSPLGWSLSEEFTDQLKSRLVEQSQFYVNIPQKELLSRIANPLAENATRMKETFAQCEYVVFTELIEHSIHPRTLTGNFLDKITPSSELTMTMRVRVFDIRGDQPQTILQEFIHQKHTIPKTSNLAAPNPGRWKRLTHTVSPLGLAHTQLAKEVVRRIEDYIRLSKNS